MSVARLSNHLRRVLSVSDQQAHRDDQEFLPAALAVMERPPSPIAMAMILSICAMAAAALLWATFGWTDIVAVAPGKVQPDGRVRTVQPLETGRVRRIAARNGQHVDTGDVLVELDPDEAGEDVRMLAQGLAAAQAEVARRDLALAAAVAEPAAKPLQSRWPADLPPPIRQREEAVLEAELASLGAQMRSLDAQRAQKDAEVARLTETIARQEDLVDALGQRVQMRQSLLSKDAGTRGGLIDAQESLLTQLTVLAGQRGQLNESRRAAETLAAERDRTLRQFRAEQATKRSEASRQADELAPRLAKARLRVERMVLRSPVKGTVQASSVTSVGQVLTVGQEAMRVVPDLEALELEVYLPNKDAGFVREGQSASIKVDAFPFTRYGTLDATVVRVATDAIPEPDARVSEADPTRGGEGRLVGAGQRVQNLVYPVVLRTGATGFTVDGQLLPLTPGMAIVAEIKTGKRRLIDYVLSPLVEVTSTAGRER
ncbi:HlyD family type I secretion periplasmic adaptor subunit [uncultured Alsobacter sp.]|uniref:HlyD family type I secretion periplasmic adaptor subunit n=1 Tax=uncultured Alsobacter sp. TaxID=1748258 RepID=UPI0025FC922D|nr:HlyD family type I secretion periplasmic adaptor subunit [uncultured Alsobacter sp.]